MKKFIYILSIILFILAISCVGIWFAPYILNVNIIKQKILTKVEHKLDAKVSIKTIKWIWLPFSHIELIDVNFKQKDLKIKTPYIIIYPDINNIFSGKIGISEVIFKHPKIEILNIKTKSNSRSNSISFPAKKISIKDATLIWHTDFHNIKRIYYFNKLNVKAKLANIIDLDINCIPPAAKYLALNLKFNMTNYNYNGKFKIVAFKAHKIFLPYISKQIIRPIKTLLNVKGIFSGNSTKKFSIQLKGSLPCIVLQKQDKYLNISCGNINLDIQKRPQFLNIVLKKIDLKNPYLQLSGRCSIYSIKNNKSIYSINFIGKNIDLTSIRKQLLTLWNKQKVLKIVCNIVRGGTATLATFRFHGPLKDLKDINKLCIDANIKNGNIYIPYGELNITNVNSNIHIEDGILIAKNISAKLEDNYAKNGLLLLGLHGDIGDLFHLKLDINSNLSQLPDILTRVVPNKHFNQELSLITNINGRAIGNLYLGESLKHIKYRITIKKAKVRLTYNRLYWPIKIDNIHLFIDNRLIKWSQVNGFFGQEKILNSSGIIILQPRPWLILEQLYASLDATNCINYLKHYPKVLNNINQIITNIKGKLIVKNCYIKGPIDYFKDWTYKINIISNNCTLLSPKLPGILTFNKCNIILQNNRLNIINISGRDNNSPINLNGYLKWYKNQLFGSLHLSGILNKTISLWIKEHNWIPLDYFPAYPLNIKKLDISWNDKNVKLIGLFNKVDKQNNINVVLNLISSKDIINIDTLKIHNLRLNQSLSMSLRFNRLNKSIKLLWDGSLSNKTLNNILIQNNILDGQIKGSFSFRYNPDINSYKFLGILNGSNLIWKWGVKKPLYLRQISISGNKNKIVINNLSAIFPDKNILDLAGSIILLKKNLKLNLICSSNYLTSKTLNILSDNSSKDNNGPKISGNISFYINRYKYFMPKNNYLIFSQLTGKVYISNSKIDKLYIEHTWLCNLAISGCIYPAYCSCKSKKCPLTTKEHQQSCYLWIRTIKGRKNNFKDILQCLNIKQDMISGNLNINIKLLGSPKCWHKGSVHIWSNKGRIYKFAALAKILSIINFTDLITEGVPKLNKKGFGYSKLDIKGVVVNNKLKLEQAYVKGEGLNIFGTGWINIKNWHVDLTVLVSPFKTIDIVLKYIPIVGEIIGGKNRTFITIPIGIKGPINDPKVKLLPISAIGKGLLGIVKRTLGLPIIVIKSIKDL